MLRGEGRAGEESPLQWLDSGSVQSEKRDRQWCTMGGGGQTVVYNQKRERQAAVYNGGGGGQAAVYNGGRKAEEKGRVSILWG